MTNMKILIACEFSGRVRDAFIKKGFDAISCDIYASDSPGPHYRGRVEEILNDGWDALIAFPPCTHLAISGARHFFKKEKEQKEALNFVKLLMDAPIKHIAIENPKGVISTKIRKPDQILQPWQFGHEEKKGVCLWLSNLPLLRPTKIVDKGNSKIRNMPAYYNRADIRSLTYLGMAEAMADQWGTYLRSPDEWNKKEEEEKERARREDAAARGYSTHRAVSIRYTNL